ncbi:MAG: MBL fold metallo-hydrolase [Planctomycetota bacterium]
MNRRNFISGCGICGAHLFALSNLFPTRFRSIFEQEKSAEIEVTEPWGRIEKVADRTWALISTPFETNDFTTVCNGGIVQGDRGVLVVESYMRPEGAKWMAEQAKILTGKWPTDIVSTHHHADHSAGHLGFYSDSRNPRIWLTESTKESAEKGFAERNMQNNEFKNVSILNSTQTTTIDLGNRKVKVIPRSGHTQSDVTIELEDPKVIWCGDLFFNRMFPNYGDAIPNRIHQYVDGILSAPDAIYVPGHGPLANQAAFEEYKRFLGYVETEAKRSFDKGDKAKAGAAGFKLPESLKDWMIWSPQNAEKAFSAWYNIWESPQLSPGK